MRKLILLVVIIIIIFTVSVALAENIPGLLAGIKSSTNQSLLQIPSGNVKVVTEESVTIDTVKKVGPSVVTVSEQPTMSQNTSPFDVGPFQFFQGIPNQTQQPQAQSIGSGFIISVDGLVVTNKHVVSDMGKYQIITADNKKYDVQQIYRDPLNDIAILKINPGQNAGETLKPVIMGNSNNLEVGQFAIAIGTALGEFRNTVTTGVISGLGRGITAGDQFQGSIEDLSNVIQTSAPINPGNSGGPLVNSASEVIGINTAVAQNGQNIGFALPISVVENSLKNFNQTGQFDRAYIGIAYRLINRDISIMNGIPEGAYVQSIVPGSPADKAGIQPQEIITKMDNQKIGQDGKDLAAIINSHKPGDTVPVTIWNNNQTVDLSVTLTTAPNQ